MSQLIVVSMTHFYAVEEEDVKWRQRVNRLHEEDQFLYKLVSHFHGDRPIRARHPSHIISCDDFTDYICEGIQPDRSTDIGLIARASLKSKATDSMYHHDNSNTMNGRRLKHHVIGNGCGDTAQPCISIYVTDAEMPDTDFMVMEVDGLSKSGCELGDNSESGRVLLLKGTPSSEKRRFAWIRDNNLFPFVEKIRKKYDDFNPDTGALPSGKEHTVVVWCDGNTSQINTATSEEGLALYKEKIIIVNKHNAAGTATQQPMDTSRRCLRHTRGSTRIPQSSTHLQTVISSRVRFLASSIRCQGPVLCVSRSNLRLLITSPNSQGYSPSHATETMSFMGLLRLASLTPKSTSCQSFSRSLGVRRQRQRRTSWLSVSRHSFR